MDRNTYVFPESKKGGQLKDIARPIKQSGSIPPLYMEGQHSGSVDQRHYFWMMFNKPAVSIPPLYMEGLHGGSVDQRHFFWMMYKKATFDDVSRAGIRAGNLERLGEQAYLSMKNVT